MNCPNCEEPAIKVPPVFDKTGELWFCNNPKCGFYEIKFKKVETKQ